MAPKPGNRNALTNGRHAYFTSGRLPRGASYVSRCIRGMRAALETALMERHGTVSIPHAALVSSATRHEARALLTQRLLREADELPVMDRRQLLADFTAATEARDRCIAALGLDAEAHPFAALFASGSGPAESEGANVGPTPIDAAAATAGASSIEPQGATHE